MTTQPPTPRCHRRTLGAVFALMLVSTAAQPAAAQTPEMPRVRSDDLSIAALINEGQERSATFRRLVETIDASDGIVYIEEGRCYHGVRACLMLSVTVAGPSRVLRIVVDTRKADWDLMGSIGHEMRHAVEVLSDASVRSSAAVYFFYQRIASSSRRTFETEAAIKAGLDVRAEARNQPGERHTH